MSRRGSCAVAAGALLGALLTTVGCGDSVSTGSLFVAVTDSRGAAVVNATVTTMPPTQSLVTDTLGTAFFTKIPAGGYAVTATHPIAGAGRVAVEVKASDVGHAVVALSPGITLPVGTGGAGGGPGGPGGSAAGTGGHGGAAVAATGGAAGGRVTGSGGADRKSVV